MADDDLSLGSGYDSPQSDSGSESEPSFAPDHDSDTQVQRPGSTDSPVTEQEIQEKTQAINDEKDRIQKDRYRALQDENNLQQELDAIKAEGQNMPKPPVPTALPAPPDQNAKNGIAVAATQILKWGTLVGLAYGLRGRSKNRNAIFKLGLGAALQGYMQGDNEMRNRAMTMWEKNRAAIIQQNRDQQQTYKDIMENKRLTLAQKMDVFREQSTLFNDARTHDAAIRSDMKDLQKSIDDRDKLRKDFQEQTRKLSDQWLGWIGLKKADGIDYRNWVMSKGGPDISKAKNEDEAIQIETDHPRWKMIQELAGQKAQEKLATEKETEQRKADEAFELHKKEKAYDMKLQQDGAPTSDPDAPISDQKAQEMRDKIFGGGSD